MSSVDDDCLSWRAFQGRIKSALIRAATEYEEPQVLLIDLQVCELCLRDPELSVEDNDCPESPVAVELQATLKSATEDGTEYDEVCAANIVLASLNALANQGAHL